MRSFAIALGCLMAFPVCAATVDVENVRIWSAPDHTRVVLDLEHPVEYGLKVLRDPDRVVIDLRSARLLKHPPRARAGDRLLARLRAAHHKRSGRTDLRVVLDVKRRVRPRTFLLEPNRKYGHRLVVDVYPRDDDTEKATVRKRAADAAPKGRRDVLVAIDAGHGGEDPGAVTRSGLREKDVVLAIARALQHRISRTPGVKAVMIRDGDYYVDLRRRIRIARRHRADLFVSIHADSFRDPRVSGSSVYVLSRRGASSEMARQLANQENASDLIGGASISDKSPDVARVLVDMQQDRTLGASSELGARVRKALARVGGQHKRRIERAGFLVLKSPDVPSILVETGFLTNPADAKRLSSPRHQKAVAGAILDGILDHLDRSPPPGTVFAAIRRHTIVRGDTLSEIAQKYGVPIERLRAANRIRGSVIRVGRVLRIPGRSDG